MPPFVDEACYQAGVCQTGTDGDGNNFGYNMGQFNNQFTQFYESKFGSLFIAQRI